MTVAEKSALTAALAKAQADLPTVGKSETAEVKSDKGNYSYHYADLAAVSKAILPLLGKHGLAFTARPTLSEGRFVLAYELRHEGGESIGGEYPLSGNTPQQIGSAVTYARRYCLCAITGLAPQSDDDDAKAASTRPQETYEVPPTDAQAERFGHFRMEITAASLDGLTALVPEIRQASDNGEITARQNRRLAQLWQERKAALEAKTTEPTSEEPSDG